MTFYDPASIESGCVYARGRNHKRHRVEMLSNIVFWVTLIELQIVCFGIPTTEYYSEVSTLKLNSTNDAVLIPDEVDERSKTDDTSLDVTNSSINAVIFIDVPQHTETALGTLAILACRTAEPVVQCQWSWRPLPPVNLPLPDINPSLNSNKTTREVVAVSPTATTQSVPLQTFPAFGNESNDCSVRFEHTKYEQIGYWTCAVQSHSNGTFISTEPVMLSIASDKPDVPIIFHDSEDVEAPAGSSTHLICRTSTPVNECQWFWRLFNQSEENDVATEGWRRNDGNITDCSIELDDVLLEQEGFWTCAARMKKDSIFVKTKPISLFVSEVKFVQLSQGIQAAAGESAQLRCLVDKPVVRCEWSWKPLNSNKEPEVRKMFVPNIDNKHDCAVRFKNVLHEEEGIWTCGVRLTSRGPLHEAEPAKLTLLPSAKFNFTELPENTSVPIGSQTVLQCAASSRVEKCTWLWRPLIDDVEIAVMHEYVGQGNLGKNCSLDFSHVRIEDQGYWSCRISLPSSNTVLTSPSIRLIVYNEGPVEFSELSRYIQKSLGSSVFLKCTTSSAVEKCQWSLTPANSNTTVVVKQLSPVDNESKDCSVRLSHALAEQQGLWTCGVKPYGKNTYINAQPAKLELLEPEPVTVALWTNSHEKVTLACKLYPIPNDTKCQWIHELKNTTENNNPRKLRQDLKMNHSTGICTLQFKPDIMDLGEWSCKFVLAVENDLLELGNASLMLLLTRTENHRLGWIVGIVTTLVLFSMILTVVLVVFKARLFTKKKSRIFETAIIRRRTQLQDQNQRTCDRHLSPINMLNNSTSAHHSQLQHNIETSHSRQSHMYESFSTL